MEEIEDDMPHWSLDRYGAVACHLGQFNGAYLSGHPMPADPWLSVGWLRDLVRRGESGLETLRKRIDNPNVRRAFPAVVVDGLELLWSERAIYLDMIDQLPQSFCHRDANWRNLFFRNSDGSSHTVAVDWAEAGRGAIGEEIVSLVGSAIVFGDVLPKHFSEIDKLVFEGYLKGLREAGWEGDPRIPRLGYALALPIHYCFKTVGGAAGVLSDEDRHELIVSRLEKLTGRRRGITEICNDYAEAMQFMVDIADEASYLLHSLRL